MKQINRRQFFPAFLLLFAGSFISVTPASAQTGVRDKAASAGFKRLLKLQAALKKIPIEKLDIEPHRSFIKKNEMDITFSEPSGEYYVRSDRFWQLREKYEDLAIADDIAWTAAKNPLPGECEGYLNCYLYAIRSTDIQYLNFYPNGKYSRRALQEIAARFASIAADLKYGASYTGPAEVSDRAELAKLVEEMNAILLKVAFPERTKALEDLRKIGDAYR